MKKLSLLLGLILLCNICLAQSFTSIKQITGTGSDYIKGMSTDASGNVYVIGGFTGTINFGGSQATALGSDVWFGKYNSSGNLVWAYSISGGNDDFGTDIAVDNSGNVYITGYFNGQSPAPDFDPGPGTALPTVSNGIFIAKYNSSGTYQWVRTYGGNSVGERAWGIAVDGSSNVYVAGELSSSTTMTVNLGGSNLSTANGSIFFAKYSSAGSHTWSRIVGPANSVSSLCHDISLDASSNVYITGYFNGTADFHPTATSPTLNSNSGSAYICKYNSSGNYVWTKQVSGQAGDIGRECVVDASGNVYVTGNYAAGNWNIMLAKFNSSGTQLQSKTIGGGSGSDVSHSLAVDASGNLFMSGYFSGTNIDFNFGSSSGQKLLTATSGVDFFYGKYSTSNLDCQWARNMDISLSVSDYEVNGTRISNGQLVVAGNFKGSGDFNSCGSSTVHTATTLDAFFARYTTNDPLFSITGPNAVCSSGSFTFSAQNVPPGATVSWSTSPSNLLSPSSGTGTTFSPTAIGSGQVTVTAQLSIGCFPPVSKIVQAGPFSQLQVGVTGTAGVCPSNSYNYYANVPGGHQAGYTYQWSWPSNWFFQSQFENRITLSTPSGSVGGGIVSVSVNNGCGGSSPVSGLTVFPGSGCPSSFSVSPNPATDELTVAINMEAENNVADDESALNESLDEYQVELATDEGHRVLTQSSKNSEVKIDTRSLQRGFYILKISYKDEVITKRILLN